LCTCTKFFDPGLAGTKNVIYTFSHYISVMIFIFSKSKIFVTASEQGVNARV
jgi:hypothetical protein